jgi:hypothetical protein
MQRPFFMPAVRKSLSDKMSVYPLLFWQRCQGKITESTTIRLGGNQAMRKLCGIGIAIALTASPVAWAEPLSPGKPAGVRTAQLGEKEWLVFGGIAALGIGIAIATSGGRSSAANSSQPVSVVTTSGTAV